ncbi:hypothetical protein F2P56_019204 [Juglans regia]|uniref:Uncharacterized protein n=2 Tax=Juglans regia TaxID=51240 RepID=A0A834CSC9_JUGRE|nr:uncharacterized protein LOC108987721 [Juglans regia]KAF5463281.1 hypothetical protein F2P56_019204 [Juglans regia]
MEARLLEIEEQLRKMGVAMEALQQENESLRQKEQEYSEGAMPNHIANNQRERGFVGGGTSASSRQAHARRARYEEVYTTDRPPKQPRRKSSKNISFGEEDCEGVLYPHDDALVVTLLVTNYTTRQILINNGSSGDILLWEVFTKMGIDPSKLKPSPMLLKGFSGNVVQPLGTITLLVIARKGAYIATTMTDFLVIRAPLSYNTILGHSTLNRLKGVTSTYHLKIKFPTKVRVGEVRNEQALARECFVQELK